MNFYIHFLFSASILPSLSQGQIRHAGQSSANNESEHQPNNNETHSQPTCSVEIVNGSALYLSRKILSTKAKFIPLLYFNLTESQYNATKETIFPLRWAWKYRDTYDNQLMHVSWPPDYGVLSGHLLDVDIYKGNPIFINIKLHPANCSFTFGQEDTVYAIAKAFTNITDSYLVNFDREYYRSRWCYLSEKMGVKDTIMYKLGLQLGVPVQAYGYRCCLNNGNFYTRIKCSSDVIPFVGAATILPYVSGVILFFGFIMFLLRFFHYMVQAGKNNVCIDHRGNEWMYISNYSPISFSKMLFGLCGLADRHPVLVSRVRRFLYVIFLPGLLYLRILLFYVNEKDIIIELAKHEIPLGFNSVIAGFKASQNNFLTYVGGPWIFFISYIILGWILLLVPGYEGELLCKGLESENTDTFNSVLTMDLSTIEELSLLKFKHFKSYKKLSFALKTYGWMVLNPKFWIYSVKFQITRWRNLPKIPSNKYLRFISIIPLYVLFCVIELILALLFYGIPILAFLITALKAYKILFQLSMRDKYLCLRLTAAAAFSFGTVYFTFAYTYIMLATFATVGKVLVYTYFALVIFPDYSFGYLIYAGSSVFYLIKITADFGNGYQKLLRDIIKISETSRIENESERVRYENNTAGIPRSLYTYMVNIHRPVYKQVLLSVVKIFGIISLFYFSFAIYRQYNGASGVLGLLNVVSVIIIGAVPRLLESVYSNTEQENEHRWKKLETSIAMYYETDQRLAR